MTPPEKLTRKAKPPPIYIVVSLYNGEWCLRGAPSDRRSALRLPRILNADGREGWDTSKIVRVDANGTGAIVATKRGDGDEALFALCGELISAFSDYLAETDYLKTLRNTQERANALRALHREATDNWKLIRRVETALARATRRKRK